MGLERLRRRSEFLEAATGHKIVTPAFVLQVRRAASDGARVGFTVSRKVGNAVERNRVRRRLRELVRLASADFPAGYDYVFVGRRAALDATQAHLRAGLADALRRLRRKAAGSENPPAIKSTAKAGISRVERQIPSGSGMRARDD